MKDKISKFKNLLKKYGVTGTLRKVWGFTFSNYLVKISVKERLYVALNRKRLIMDIDHILNARTYDRIVMWRSSFGWNVPLYQRPQHIFTNFAKQRTLVFYEVTQFTDDVKRIKKQADNLYLVNYANGAFSKLLMSRLDKCDSPKYLQFYSTDWTMPVDKVMDYKKRGYGVIYEYIDDLSPHLAGTDELPVNVRQKYDMAMHDTDVFVVVTAEALRQDVISKRGNEKLIYSSNGVDYDHFRTKVDFNFELDSEFREIFKKGQPVIGYYGALAQWVDYDLLKEIDKSGKYQFVLLGIKYDDSYDKSQIEQCENIHFLGSKPYHELQNYAAHIDVLTIPFLINDITKATSPVKLFEYMALHKPIVTTDMDECRKYESVLIAHSPVEFLELIDEALSLKNERQYIELLDKEALENTWEEKARIIIQSLKSYENGNA